MPTGAAGDLTGIAGKVPDARAAVDADDLAAMYGLVHGPGMDEVAVGRRMPVATPWAPPASGLRCYRTMRLAP